MGLLGMNDVEFESMRSGGPGGQHGDRRATAVRLRISIDEIPIKEERREDLRDYLPSRYLTEGDELIVQNGDTRSQRQNREKALEQANDAIRDALEQASDQREKQRRQRRVKKSSGGGSGERDIKEEQKKRRRSETTDDLLEQAYEEDPETMESYVEDDENDDGDQ